MCRSINSPNVAASQFLSNCEGKAIANAALSSGSPVRKQSPVIEEIASPTGSQRHGGVEEIASHGDATQSVVAVSRHFLATTYMRDYVRR